MRKLYPLLEALVFIGAAIALLLGLAGCAATTSLPAVLSAPLDTTLVHQARSEAARLAVAHLSTGRLTFKGPVTIQIGGSGNNAASTNASKAKAPVAAAPYAAASETKTSAGWPWQLIAGGALLLLGLGFYAGHRLKIPWPF